MSLIYMSESHRSNSEDAFIISIQSHPNDYQVTAKRWMKTKQNSEKVSWIGLDLQSVGKVGTKGNFNSPFLTSMNEKISNFLRENFVEDTRPPLITFTPITEEQLCKEAAPINIYSKGCFHQQNEMLYRVFKTDARLVRSILDCAGFVSTDCHDWNIMWVGSSGQNYLYEGLNEFQKINHFPNSFELTRKDKMYININAQATNYGKEDYNFIPETFLLPEQYNDFYAAFHRNKGSMWIHKPNGSSQGKGIFLVSSPNDIPLNTACVVSKYISNPLLINELKFDIRIYVLVSSFDPLRIYIYDEGLARFASEIYNPVNINNRFSHLTNYSVNKKNEKFIQNKDWRQDNIGHKWSLAALNTELETMGIDTVLLWTKIYDIIIKSIISIEPLVLDSLRNLSVKRNNCFDLFGFDVLIDSNLKPWLLEVNLSPSMATDSPLDLHIKSNLISDTFNLIGVRAFDRKKETVNKVKARIKARQIQLARDRKKIGDQSFSFIKESNQGKSEEIIKEALEEYERRGNFLRIYPSKGCDHYERFFSGIRPNNKILFKFLYNDLWEENYNLPLKTVIKEVPLSKVIHVTEENESINFDELMIEYILRLSHALNVLTEDCLKQEWKLNIEYFVNHQYWGSPLKNLQTINQKIEDRATELRKKGFDNKKMPVIKALSAIRLEIMLRNTAKNVQLDLINSLFVDDKVGILSDIIKWLSNKAQKFSLVGRKKSKEDNSSTNHAGSFSPIPSFRNYSTAGKKSAFLNGRNLGRRTFNVNNSSHC
ncbi:hypothetical protein SteCoe_35753 [Stentor coeruleus]|uniref:Tubulin--tyrosine ligase-like protein 5 n=1 Tax=Stentor coeruleus TaxID=5963 RepID=A0A1R2ARP1_9CILI|nr:hypothetical protein SteCoe_35753 [Stentor coeruleus]